MINKFFIDVFTNHYIDFSGRATREQYWMFYLFNFLFWFVLWLLGAVTKSGVFAAVMFIYWLAVLLPFLGISVRRLHDIDKSGWWFLINFVPVIGGIVFFVFTLLPSTGANRFGSAK